MIVIDDCCVDKKNVGLRSISDENTQQRASLGDTVSNQKWNLKNIERVLTYTSRLNEIKPLVLQKI